MTVTLPVSLTFKVATFDDTDVVPLPEVKDKAPLDVSVPEPVIVAVPEVPVDKLMPPLAVTVLLTVMLLPLVVRENDPAPSLLLFSCMAPVCETVTEPPLVVLVSCAAAVVTDVAAVPALIVNVPVVLNVPEPDMVLEPLTPRVMPPLAVIPPPKLRLPPDDVNEILPEPTDTLELVSMPPVALTVRDEGVPASVPSVSVEAPWVTDTEPVSFTFNVATFAVTVVAPVPAFKDSAPVDVRVPEPPIVPAPLVVSEMPPLAVTVVLAVILLPALSLKVKEAAEIAFNCMLPVWVIVSAPVEVLANLEACVFTVIAPLPLSRVTIPVELSDPDPDIVPAPDVVSVMPPLAVTVPDTVILLPLFAVKDNELLPSLLVLSCMLPVCEIVSEALEVELVS